MNTNTTPDSERLALDLADARRRLDELRTRLGELREALSSATDEAAMHSAIYEAKVMADLADWRATDVKR